MNDQEWQAWIEQVRREEGFNGRVTPWQTFDTPLPRRTMTPSRKRREWADGRIHCRRCGAVWNGGLCCVVGNVLTVAS